MAAKLRPFSGWITSRAEWEVRHRDGRPQSQVSVAVLATGRQMAANILTEVTGSKVTVGFVRDFIGESGNPETVAALARHPRGTVLIKPMDPGGTVKGQSDWVAI